jgi:GNAT superfamily N-acetyltransferase
MTRISVRLGCHGDAEAMAAIYVAAARRAWSHIYGSKSLETLQSPTERFWSEIGLTEQRHCVLVAERDEVVLGFAIVRPSQDEDADRGHIGELDMLYTEPSVWGAGIGRALLASAVNELRDAGFVEATLWTAEANHRPRRVYEAAGWRPDGSSREREWRGVGFRELRYQRDL